MSVFYIGIDGGGTKTKAVLQDENGRECARSVCGPANIRISVQNSYNSIVEAFENLLKQAGLYQEKDTKKHIFYAGIGVAGFEVPKCREEFLKLSFPFDKCFIKSDSYVCCLGAHGENKGALIIVGTGVVGIKLDGENKTKIGGFGFPHGDEGSGAWLGLEAVRRTLHMCDGRHIHTPLLLNLKKHLGDDVQNIVQWACFAGPTHYAGLGEMIVDYARKGDLVGKELLKLSAGHIERIYRQLVCKNPNETKAPITPCALMGGLSSTILEYLNPEIAQHISPPKGDACAGALLMLKKLLK